MRPFGVLYAMLRLGDTLGRDTIEDPIFPLQIGMTKEQEENMAREDVQIDMFPNHV